LIQNKKGGIMDLFLAIIFSFILAICLVLFMYAQNTVEDELLEIAPKLQESFSNNTNVTQIIVETVGATSTAYTSFKWISVLLIFGFFLGVIISSFVVRTHPAWFIGYVFIVIVSVIFSVYVSNVYEELMSDPTLAQTFLTGFFAQNWIFLHLPIWVTVIGFLAGILMYINLNTGRYYG